MSHAPASAACQVLIVGAGPVGLTMAVELVRQGLRPRIIDQAPQATDKSKALVLWGRTLENLDTGDALVPNLIAAGQWSTGASIYGDNRRLVHLTFDRPDTAFPRPLMIPQCDTERILAAHLRSLGVEVERNVSLTDFVDQGDSVLATLHHADGRAEQVVASWLLGCDGAHSTVRHRLGFSFGGECEPNDWILADVRVSGPVAPMEISVHWHAQGIAVFFHIGDNRFRVVADLGLAPGVDKPKDPTLAEVQSTLDARGLSQFQLHDPIWLAGFRIHERKVAEYSRGRAFLAGDAAHIHSPAGGQGMNTGMQDACNLAWKLTLVEQGRARAETLLPSYSQERSAVGDMVLSNAAWLTRVATLRNPLLQFIRNHVAHLAGSLSAVQARAVANLTEMTVHYPDSPLNADDPGHAWSHALKPGDRLPDAMVRTAAASAEQRLLQLLPARRHHLLVYLDRGASAASIASQTTAVAALQNEWGDAIAPLFVVAPELNLAASSPLSPPTAVVDHLGQVRQRWGLEHTALALVRPDGYLAFRGHGDAWSRLRQHLSSYLLSG